MIGTLPNEFWAPTMVSQAKLYVLGDAPPDDPLDCVAAATPILAGAFEAVHQVGPGQAMSLRAFRRNFQPGTDSLLYDLTAPSDYEWALRIMKEAPAAVLIAGYNIVAPTGGLTGLRSSQRYVQTGFRLPEGVTSGTLDAKDVRTAGQVVRRPAVHFPKASGTDLVLSVGAGAIEQAYGALLGLRALGKLQTEIALDILAYTRQDANELADILSAFQMPAGRVRYVRKRAEIAAVVAGARAVIDVSTGAETADSDAVFVAKCIGAPVMGIADTRLAAEMAFEFAGSPREPDPVHASDFADSRPLASFADALLSLIEMGRQKALVAAHAA